MNYNFGNNELDSIISFEELFKKYKSKLTLKLINNETNLVNQIINILNKFAKDNNVFLTINNMLSNGSD